MRYIQVLTLLVVFGCQSPMHRISSVEASDTVAYSVRHLNKNFITHGEVAGILSTQQLFVRLIFHNKSDKSIHINLYEWELETSEGMRSIPVYADSSTVTLMPSESIKIKLLYQPVNSRSLYQLTGLRGDLHEEYFIKGKIKVSSGEDVEESLQLVADESFKPGIILYGQAVTTEGYVLASTDEFIEKQKRYIEDIKMKDRFRKEETIYFANNETLINGLWMKAETYHRNDTLQMLLRFVNQSSYDVLFDPVQVHLISESQSYPSLSAGREMVIMNGGRAAVKLQFAINRMKKFEIDLHPLTFKMKSLTPVFASSLFFEGISLRKEIIGEDNF